MQTVLRARQATPQPSAQHIVTDWHSTPRRCAHPSGRSGTRAFPGLVCRGPRGTRRRRGTHTQCYWCAHPTARTDSHTHTHTRERALLEQSPSPSHNPANAASGTGPPQVGAPVSARGTATSAPAPDRHPWLRPPAPHARRRLRTTRAHAHHTLRDARCPAAGCQWAQQDSLQSRAGSHHHHQLLLQQPLCFWTGRQLQQLGPSWYWRGSRRGSLQQDRLPDRAGSEPG